MVKSKPSRLVREVEKEFKKRDPNIDAPLHYEFHKVRDREIYVLGETHGSRAPFDYYRENLKSKVRKNPDTWLFFLEDGPTNKVHGNPIGYYFTKVAKPKKIPILDATQPSLFTDETRKIILERSGLSEEDYFHSFYSFVFDGPGMEESGKNPSRVARDLNVSLDLANKLIYQGISPYAKELFGKIGDHWNSLINEEFLRALGRYPSRTNVLVNCGFEHNVAFQDLE